MHYGTLMSLQIYDITGQHLKLNQIKLRPTLHQSSLAGTENAIVSSHDFWNIVQSSLNDVSAKTTKPQ